MRRAETLPSDPAEVEAKASTSRHPGGGRTVTPGTVTLAKRVRSDTPSTSAASVWLNGRAVVRAYTSSNYISLSPCA